VTSLFVMNLFLVQITLHNHSFIRLLGPLYQYAHDIIHECIYELVPLSERELLHKTLGDALLRSAVNNPTIQLLSVDQVNKYSGNLSQDEKTSYAQANATAANLAIAISMFEEGE